MKKLKQIGKELIALTIVAIGVKLISVYLTTGFDFLSILSGLTGFTILLPAILAYVDMIDDILKKD
jgi:hypothetical protein